MLYGTLKTFHIFAAALLILSILYCFHLWRKLPLTDNQSILIQRIQFQTGIAIIPLSFLQLFTGFTLISLQRYSFTENWIVVSVIGFIILLSSWIGFNYFLSRKRWIQSLLLNCCLITLLIMIFYMTNRIV